MFPMTTHFEGHNTEESQSAHMPQLLTVPAKMRVASAITGPASGTVRQNTVDSGFLTQFPEDAGHFWDSCYPMTPSVSVGTPTSLLGTPGLTHGNSQEYRNMGGK